MQSLIGVFIENFPQSINGQCFHHLRTSKLICIVNHLTGFYMRRTLIVNGYKFRILPEKKKLCQDTHQV